MEWEIGNIKIKNQVVVAPMAGYSNSAFRQIAKEYGAGLIYAEMVSDKAITFKNKKTIDMLYMTEKERPISQQIFGSDKESFVEAAKYIEKTMKPDIIDINMGCPVPKVALRSQAGAALLKDPKKVYEIIKAVVDSVSIPVTVKIRSGWDQKTINAKEIAIISEKAGAAAIAVHPRTRKQGYSGIADWSIIKEVKEIVKIPVIGNGDIKTALDAKKMLEETKCDAVMIGRGILGNPFLIKEINSLLLENIQLPPVSIKEKLECLLKHFNLLMDQKGEKLAILEIRSNAFWYLKGITGTKKIKEKINKAINEKEFKEIITNFIHTNI